MLCYGECVMDMSSVEVNMLYVWRTLCVVDCVSPGLWIPLLLKASRHTDV